MSEADSRVDFAHQIGHLEGRLVGLERKVDGFEQRVEGKLTAIETKLDHLHAALYLGRGGWKVITLLAALVAAMVGVAGWALDHTVFQNRVLP
jgi:hypothetical protein